MEEVKNTLENNENTGSRPSEDGTEGEKNFDFARPKCMVTEDFNRIVNYDRCSLERAKDLDDRVQKRDRELYRKGVIKRLVSLYTDVDDSPLKTVLDGLVMLGRYLSEKTDDTEVGLRLQYKEIVRKLREKGIDPQDVENK